MPASKIRAEERDIALLRGLFESRVMTTGQAATLHFDGKNEAAKKRLQKLKAAEFISERARRPFEPSVIFLTRKGLDVLREQGILTEYPPFDLPALDRRARVSELTIRHELEVMDVKTAFHSGIKTMPVFAIEEFSTWPLLHEFTAYHPARNGAEAIVKPDGFIRIHETDTDGSKFEQAFFLELDRSNETQDTLVAKAACYLEYFKSGNFAVKHGGTRDNFKKFPFRVLMVLKSADRRNNTAELLLQNTPPILTMLWLSTFAEATANPFGPIWIRPADYRDAMAGVSFDAHRQRGAWGNRPHTYLDSNFESRIKKVSILQPVQPVALPTGLSVALSAGTPQQT